MLKEKILNSFSSKKEIFKLIQIDRDGILNFQKRNKDKIKLIDKFIKKNIQKHILGSLEKTLNFFFLIRVIDFSLWKNKNYFYENLRKVLFKIYNEEREPEKFLLELKLKSFREIFGLNEPIYISKIRLRLLKEKIIWLFNYYQGSFLKFLKENNTPEKFCFALFCFKDFRDYYKIERKRKIYILKPNQLLYFACQKAIEEFNGKSKYIEELTVFADNVLPAVLEKEGILKYDKKLKEKIEKGMIIKYGSLEEISIRVNTILACEEIGKILNLPPYKIDQLLWSGGARNKKINTHKCFNFFY